MPTDLKYEGSKQLFLDHPGYTEWPVALIRPSGRGPELPSHLIPVLRAVRGTNPTFNGEDFDEYKVTGAVLPLGGRRCHELAVRGGPARPERHLWIDPSRGHVLVRYVLGPAGKPRHQIDIQYQPDSVAGFVPTGWKEVETSVDTGRIICITTAKVTSNQVNPVVPEEVFRFDLPPETFVVDETGTGPAKYITKPDGGKRVVQPGEMGKSYQELRDTPGQPQPTLMNYRWWVVGLAGLVGGCLVFARIRLVRRRTPQPGGPRPDNASTPKEMDQ
ncbi:MAG: hypothetical protein K2X82_14845 [Gemmataceae bacterium]|nr:hypothetical protein [Gemmataceae bacterium]